MKQTSARLAAALLLLCALTACGGDKEGSSTNEAKNSSSRSDELKTDPATGTRYTGKEPDDVVRYGNGYGNTNADKRAGSGVRPSTAMDGVNNTVTDTSSSVSGKTALTRYEKMLDNARVRDTDGFLLDGENASHNTLW